MNMTEAELDTLLKRNPALRVRDGKPASKTSSGVNFSPTVQQLPPNTGKPHAKYRNRFYLGLRLFSPSKGHGIASEIISI